MYADCNPCIWQGAVGPRRRAGLQRTHGFVCACERCTAPPSSPLHELERVELGLACPASDAEGHILLPHDPYDPAPSYACAATGCAASLSSSAAAEAVGGARRAFEALHAHLQAGEYEEGCRAAERAEADAARTLSPRHELWMVWTAAVLGLAGGSESDAGGELLLRAFTRKEAALLVPSRAGDEDVFVRVSHAIACGLDSHDAAEALRAAYRMDRLASGAGVEGFLARWIPEDFEQILPAARRILQSAAAA